MYLRVVLFDSTSWKMIETVVCGTKQLTELLNLIPESYQVDAVKPCSCFIGYDELKLSLEKESKTDNLPEYDFDPDDMELGLS